MKFKELAIGEAFEFAHHTIGSPHGPWIKLSARSYYRPCDVERQQEIARIYKLDKATFNPCKVGSINVDVQKLTIDAELQAEIDKIKHLLKGRLVKVDTLL